jgi:hypothetical protein
MVHTPHPYQEPTVTTSTTAWPAPRAGSPLRSLLRAAAAVIYLVGGLSAASALVGLLGWMVSSGPVGIVLAPLLTGGALGAAVRFGVPRPLLKGLCISGLVLLVAAVVLGTVVVLELRSSGFGNWMS